MSATLAATTSVLFHGVAFAMVLYLISVGLSVTMGLMGFVNLAHGAFAMLGGYVLTTLMSRFGVPFLPAAAAAAVLTGLFSIPIERLLYARFYGGGELDQVLLTIGLIFMSVAAVTWFWGPLVQPVQPPAWLSGEISLGFRNFPTYGVFLIVFGAALATLLWLGLERTSFGVQIRAAVDNLKMAQAIGINTSRLFMLAFAFGSGLAGLGGAIGAELLSITPSYGLDNLIFFLIVVAVGGLGSLRGSFVAALVIGISDTFFEYLLPQFGAFFLYALTMAILLWRPMGLFGRT